jgi:hypothetical protein
VDPAVYEVGLGSGDEDPGPDGHLHRAEHGGRASDHRPVTADLAELAPDVLAVQEVGSPAALDDLVAQLGVGWHS